MDNEENGRRCWRHWNHPYCVPSLLAGLFVDAVRIDKTARILEHASRQLETDALVFRLVRTIFGVVPVA